MSNKTIYTALINAGLTPEGACGLMGNMMAESGMVSNIAQRGMTKLSDADYTAAAEAGTINFVRDSVGYGLCQWTYWSRKSALLEFAGNMGVSVGDEDMQVQFCLQELQTSYTSVYKKLCETDNLYEAASVVCTKYERPAVNNIAARFKYAQDFYENLTKEETEEAPTTEPIESYTPGFPTITKGSIDYSVRALQQLLLLGGYYVDAVDGILGAVTYNALKAFQRDHDLTETGVTDSSTWLRLIGG